MSYRFVLPIYGVGGAKSAYKAISLNWYTSIHYRTRGNAKKKFAKMVREQIESHDPIKGKIKISYTYYAKRNGTDLDNFVGVVKKYFQDALVEYGLITDDNVTVIVANSERYGGVDKDNPRVEAVITPYDEV